MANGLAMFVRGHSRSGGELLIGEAKASALASAYGTPLVVLDYGALDDAIADFTHACRPFDIEISYAAKAFFAIALAKHLKHTTLGVDVCSMGELATAEAVTFPAERLTLHGCGKTAEELDAALSGRVGRIVVDNLDELRTLCHAEVEARPSPSTPQLLLRINTGVEAHTHDFIRTSGEHSKFGLDDDSLRIALDLLKTAPHLQFTGLHSHIGSQIYDEQTFAANAAALMESAARCSAAGFHVGTIVAGGGFGVRMSPEGEAAVDLYAAMSSIAQTVEDHAERRNLPKPAIGIEPGRALVAAAGTSLYTVMSAKMQFGRPYAIVDGGVYENPRPALYDAHHHMVCASRESQDMVETVICGRTCENDRLGTARLPRDICAGELIASFTTGAYTRAMASNYNRFSRPAVCAVRDGAHSLIVRREQLDDVLRTDIDV